jgi:predicted nucleic acid-binding protein
MARPRSQQFSHRTLFVDAVFWIALTRQTEQFHQRCLDRRDWFQRNQVRLITTEAVLWEWLNMLAKPPTRELAAGGYRRCHEGDLVEVVPFLPALVRGASALYQARPDKHWSLTDCLSFVVMQDRGLTDALTTDHHFVQAGYRALLLQNPPR